MRKTREKGNAKMDVLFETRSKRESSIKATKEHNRYYYLFQPARICTYILTVLIVLILITKLSESDYNSLSDISLCVLYGILLLWTLFLNAMGIIRYFRQKKQLLRWDPELEQAEGVSTVTEEGIRSTNADGKEYITPLSEISRAYIGKSAVFVYSKSQKVDPTENNGKKRIFIIHLFPKDDFTVGDAAGLVDWLESKKIMIKGL